LWFTELYKMLLVRMVRHDARVYRLVVWKKMAATDWVDENLEISKRIGTDLNRLKTSAPSWFSIYMNVTTCWLAVGLYFLSVCGQSYTAFDCHYSETRRVCLLIMHVNAVVMVAAATWKIRRDQGPVGLLVIVPVWQDWVFPSRPYPANKLTKLSVSLLLQIASSVALNFCLSEHA